MPQALRHHIWIIAAALLVCFANLGIPELWDGDEPLYAACAREMLARNDWIVPTFNGDILTDKPILMYWCMLSAYQVFGVSEFAARLWSAVFGVGTVLLTYHLGRRCYRAEVGLWGALAVAGCLMFGVCARAATPDSILTFFTTLAMLIFVRGMAAFDRSDEISQNDGISGNLPPAAAMLPRSWSTYAGLYAAMGIAVLTKGPVGVVLPTCVLVTFAICLRIAEAIRETERSGLSPSRRLLRSLSPGPIVFLIWKLRPLTALAIVAALNIPWYVSVGIQTDGAWLNGFFGTHNFGRFLKPMEGHSGSAFYYILTVFTGLFPWSIFAPLAAIQVTRRIAGNHAWRVADIFMACWGATYIGFFTLASTKLPSYILPAFPALALLIGCSVDGWVTNWDTAPRKLLRLGFSILAVLGLVYWLAIPIATSRLFAGESISGWAGLIPLCGGALALWFCERSQPRRAAIALSATSILFITALFGLTAVSVNSQQTSAALMARIHAASPSTAQIGSYGYFQHSMAYYAGQKIQRLGTPEKVETFFKSSPDAYVIAQEGQLDNVLPGLPPDVVVIASRRRFLKPGRIVVLGRRPSPAPTILGGWSDTKRL